MDMDQAFIDMMVPHHEAAVEMAKIAQDRAAHEELGALAVDIAEDQEREIEQLREWRRAWFGSSDTPGMDEMPMLPGMDMPGGGQAMDKPMDMTADIEALRVAEPFDGAFIEAIIPHHETAMAAAKATRESTKRAELKQMTSDMIEAQQREITQMRSWLAAWYPD